MIQAVSGNEQVPGVVVGVGSDVPDEPAAGALPAEVQASAARLPSTSAGSTRTRAATSCSSSSRRTSRDPAGKLSLVLDRQLDAADSRASAHPPPRLPRRRGQVRRDGGRRAADHAVVLREPVDGRARSVGARAAGAGQRQVRRAEGPVHPQQRRAVLRDATRSSSRRSSAIEQNRWLAATLGPNGRQFFREHYDWPVIERKYLDMFERLKKEPAARTAWSRCRAGSTGGARTCRRPKRCSPRCPEVAVRPRRRV